MANKQQRAAHTPGPWIAHPIVTNHGLPYTPVVAKTLLARVYSEAFGDYKESEANARLISAAPELLDALMSLIREHDSVFAGREDGARDVYYNAHPNRAIAYRNARAAIAKAIGPAGAA